MAVDTVTLELAGDVSLDDFTQAVGQLRALLTQLSNEVADGARITWLVDSLEAGSATTVCRGLPTDGTRPAQIESVVRAFGRIGETLERGDHVPYSRAVAQETDALLALLNDRVPFLRFETPETDATVSVRPQPRQTPTLLARVAPGAYGAIEGRVQTLSSRGGLRFTLYDSLYDRAVSCYLSEDFDQERLRGVWGRRAVVEGWVKRDPATGRPLTVRQVTDVVALTENNPGDYRQAGGAIQVPVGSPLPEQVIRRFRDGA